MRFWCLQTLVDACRDRLPALTPDDAAALRGAVASWVHEASTRVDPPVPAFIKNKLAQVTALLVRHEYPSRWPTFFHDLVALLASGGPAAPDVFCRVLDAVDDEIISTGDTLRPHGAAGDPTHAVAPSVRVKDALRADADALPKLAESWRAMIAYGSSPGGGDATVAVAAAAASTARRYVEWMDVSLFTGEGFVAAAMGLLGSGDATLRAAGADFLTALTSKGMEHAAKVEMIGRLGLVGVCRQLRALATSASGTDDADESSETSAAHLAAAVGHELFGCLRVAAVAAAAAATEPHPAPPPRATCDAAAAMIDELIPVGVAHLRSDDERTVMAALPLCTAYVNRVKDLGANAAPTAEPTLRAIVDAVISRSAFPEDAAGGGEGVGAGAGVDFSRGEEKHTLEAEQEVTATRQELSVLFRATSRLAPRLALDAVRGALVAALPEPPAPPARWQTVETALAALHLVGEGADDPAVKPGAEGPSPLGELVAFLLSRWSAGGDANLAGGVGVPAAAHRLVASAFLDLCVRYHLAVSRDHGRLLAPALAAFLDARGMRHPSPEVSRRACYLFCRFVKPLRGQIAPRLAEVLAALEEIMERASDAAGGGVGGVGGGTGGGTGGAMATAGGDDRLYVFEAFGSLLGADEVPEASQAQWLEAASARLRRRIEAARTAGDAAQAQHVVVAMANVTKGFTQRVATETRPRVGEILRAGLEPALGCLATWPRDPLVRQRVVAYFQRMVQCVGPSAFPYASPLVEHMRASGSSADLRECLVLVNQLMATFKADLAPFVAGTLPTLTRQTAAALAPLAGANGTARGILGLTGEGLDALALDGSSAAAAAAAGVDANNTEEVREARELEKMYMSHVHGVATNGLASVLAASSPPALPATRDVVLASLARWASSHPSATSRKMSLQALTKFAQAWIPTPAEMAAGTPPEGVSGFRRFAAETIAGECCVRAVLRGDLDPRDAACAAAINEAVNFQRALLERCGQEFEVHLKENLLAPMGIDAAGGDAYVRAVTSTSQTAQRDARAFLAECQRVVAAKCPGLAKRPCAKS